jgi:hypothetical protein
LHEPSRGAIHGKFPVAIGGCGRIRLGISVTFHGHVIRKFSQLAGDEIRVVTVGFQGHEAFSPCTRKKLIEHFQGVKIMLLAVFGTTERAHEAAEDIFQDIEGIADENGADGGPADNDQLGGLKQNLDWTVLLSSRELPHDFHRVRHVIKRTSFQFK